MTLFAYDEQNPFADDSQATITLIASIDNLKILDPACGSGAFPIGILQRLVTILGKLDPDNERWKEQQRQRLIAPVQRDIQTAQKISYEQARDQAISQLEERLADIRRAFEDNDHDYARKLFLIENCIYGVDIQPIAVQIAKLRCFISLIVDQRVEEDKPNRGMLALPNLETKFVAANTLIGIDKPAQTMLEDPALTKKQAELRQLRHEHFQARRWNDKKKLRQQDKTLRKEIAELLKSGVFKGQEDTAEDLANWNPYNQNASADFFDAEWMFGLTDGFDVVIGNPPYMRIQGIRASDPELATYLKEKYRSATGSFDIYVTFAEKGLQLLNRQGILNYIMPDKWTNAAFGKGLREVVTQGKNLKRLISFGAHQVFNASTYTSLLWLVNKESNRFDYLALEQDLPGNDSLGAFLQNLDFKHLHQVDTSKLGKDVWILASGNAGVIMEKLNGQQRRIKDVFQSIFQGIATSKDSVYFLSDCKIDNSLVEGYSPELGKRVCVEAEIAKPLLKGDQVHRYVPLQSKNLVLFPYHVDEKKAHPMSPSYIRENLPKAWEYFLSCESVVKGREKGRLSNEDTWYRYIYPKNLTLFNQEKLLSPDISKRGNFSYDALGKFYMTTTVYGYIKYSSISEDYRFWLAIMNSQLLWFYLQNAGTVLANGYFRYKPAYLNEFPLPTLARLDMQKPFVALVDYLLYLKSSTGSHNGIITSEYQAIISYFERIIDGMVYELYFPDDLRDAGRCYHQVC